jgi:hypothetical protein
MLGDLTNDLSVVFSTDDFAETATFTPSGGSASSVIGIFDTADVESDVGGVPVIISGTRFQCAAADVIGVAEGDSLVIRGVSYLVATVEDDGMDTVTLRLEIV